MAIARFSSYAAFKSAAAVAGLTIEHEPPSHEGPHESDIFEPTVMLNAVGESVGIGGNVPVGENEIEFEGLLCSTHAEFMNELHADDHSMQP